LTDKRNDKKYLDAYRNIALKWRKRGEADPGTDEGKFRKTYGAR